MTRTSENICCTTLLYIIALPKGFTPLFFVFFKQFWRIKAAWDFSKPFIVYRAKLYIIVQGRKAALYESQNFQGFR